MRYLIIFLALSLSLVSCDQQTPEPTNSTIFLRFETKVDGTIAINDGESVIVTGTTFRLPFVWQEGNTVSVVDCPSFVDVIVISPNGSTSFVANDFEESYFLIQF